MNNLEVILMTLLVVTLIPANRATVDISTILNFANILTGKSTATGGSKSARKTPQKNDHHNYLRALGAEEVLHYGNQNLGKFMKLPEPAQELCFRVALAYLKANDRELIVLEPYMPHLIRRILVDWMDLFYRHSDASAEAMMNLVEKLPADGVIRKEMHEGLGLGRQVFKWYHELGPYKQMLKTALAVTSVIG